MVIGVSSLLGELSTVAESEELVAVQENFKTGLRCCLPRKYINVFSLVKTTS
jgi:hypothetical protein